MSDLAYPFVPSTPLQVTRIHLANFCADIRRAKTPEALQALLPKHLPYIPDNLRPVCGDAYKKRLAQMNKGVI